MSADESPSAAELAPGAITRREQRLRLDARVEIVLLRHGEPDWTPGGGLSVEDAHLTARGRRQAQAAAERLAESPIDAIYVSPLRGLSEIEVDHLRAAGLR